MRWRGAMILVWGLFLTTTGCFYDVDGAAKDIEDAGADGDTDADADAGDETGNVVGTVMIDDGLDSASYAVGDLYLSFLAECPTGVEEVEVYGLFVIEDLDFSAAEATRVFAINGAPAGVSYLSGFLDSDGSVTSLEEAAPALPDAITSSCVEIDLAPGETLTDVELTLDMTMPF